MFRVITSIIILLPPGVAVGEVYIYQAYSVQAEVSDVKCFEATRGWVFDTSGPCKGFVPPANNRFIAIGDTFEVNGKRIKIGFIEVLYADKAFADVKAGDISCTAAASRSQIPSGRTTEFQAGLWLYIQNCHPIQLGDELK